MNTEMNVEMATDRPLKILVVDDEALARRRLHDLLNDCRQALPLTVVGEVENGREALHWVQNSEIDLLLSDIQMPDMSGIELAQHLLKMKRPPRVIFVTAFNEHAVKAFELNAIDYLMKPVRIDRLLTALRKVPALEPISEAQLAGLPTGARRFLPVVGRTRIELVPIDEVIYFKAELKYVTIKTRERELILEESLTKLEQEFTPDFVRTHRSYLVAKWAIKSLMRGSIDGHGADSDHEDDGWKVELQGISELLPVSRRQRGALQAMLKSGE
ncbi:MAG: LytTR family DNA-binding domain-containing protein [Proteobacteria bacterium]|nr:LytTR family DNA-binding domain-containing protein [Pseudomonadota bacterium]MCL2308037.1 LytTR family DNA-binding domain-containing protein [Pseudomonadota bacterium]